MSRVGLCFTWCWHFVVGDSGAVSLSRVMRFDSVHAAFPYW